MKGKLRSDLFAWLEKTENEADLCLCLGSSLSGMNADRMAKNPAKRARQNPSTALGTIIINLQQTELDDQATIRIWGKLDAVFQMLVQKLNIDSTTVKPTPIVLPDDSEFYLVPYDTTGKKDATNSTYLDLRQLPFPNQIVITDPNAPNFGCIGYLVGKDGPHYKCTIQEKDGSIQSRLLGNWWVADAIQGKYEVLPLMNTDRHRTKVAEYENQKESGQQSSTPGQANETVQNDSGQHSEKCILQ